MFVEVFGGAVDFMRTSDHRAAKACVAVAVSAFLTWGVVTMVNDPPRIVATRKWQIELDPEQYACGTKTVRDGNGTSHEETEYCTRWEPHPHYYAVSADGGTCHLGRDLAGLAAYEALRRGTALKCWQLFGWRGGTPQVATSTW